MRICRCGSHVASPGHGASQAAPRCFGALQLCDNTCPALTLPEGPLAYLSLSPSLMSLPLACSTFRFSQMADGLDPDVGRLALRSAQRLMDHDASAALNSGCRLSRSSCGGLLWHFTASSTDLWCASGTPHLMMLFMQTSHGSLAGSFLIPACTVLAGRFRSIAASLTV